jgi:hypothetical protein
MKEKILINDFNDFLQANATVPQNTEEGTLAKIKRVLTPSAQIVFAKLFGIHLLVGTLNLGICDQFGISPFNTGFSLSDYFMKLGDSACMCLCGFLFIGLSISLAAFLLTREEFMVLRKNFFIQVFVLSIFSLAVFLAFGANIAFTIALLWVVGAFIGAALPVFARQKSYDQY